MPIGGLVDTATGAAVDPDSRYYQPGGNAGTPSAIILTNGTGLPSSGISDSTATGRSVLTAADAAAARTAIGARSRATPIAVFRPVEAGGGVSAAIAHGSPIPLTPVSDPFGLLTGGAGANVLTIPAGWGGFWRVSGAMLLQSLGGTNRGGITVNGGIGSQSVGNSVTTASYPICWANTRAAGETITFAAFSNAGFSTIWWAASTNIIVEWLSD